MSMSNMNFNDIASLIVSRTTETKFTNALFSNIGTTEQLVYTCPEDNITHILNISLCNILNGATSPIHVSAYILRNGEVDPVFIVKNVEILMGQTFVINNNEMSVNGMNSLDELYIVADTNNSTDFYSAIVEIKQ
ncbi:MAG: hypothetical protein DRQ78_09655 [Epsilonproteobacteria bacterium]|nr:MAG: hypothetical protein DRQ78_09655 [Campylobacterota bacterium]